MKVVMFVEMLQNQNLLLYFLLLLMSIIISITVINVAIITILSQHSFRQTPPSWPQYLMPNTPL